MKPSKKKINVNLDNPQQKILFLEKLQEIEGVDIAVKTKDNTIRIKVFGYKPQIIDFMNRIKEIKKGIKNGDYSNKR